MYSYGCFDIKRVASGTIIGRYCSFAPSVQFYRRSHGVDYISMHPFLYNKNLNFVNHDRFVIESKGCIVEDDVWIGHNAIITPSVEFIGRGSIVAAGAVVTRNVSPYSIVGGNPSRVIKRRFNSKTIQLIEDTGWWNLDKKQLSHFIKNNPEELLEYSNFASLLKMFNGAHWYYHFLKNQGYPVIGENPHTENWLVDEESFKDFEGYMISRMEDQSNVDLHKLLKFTCVFHERNLAISAAPLNSAT